MYVCSIRCETAHTFIYKKYVKSLTNGKFLVQFSKKFYLFLKTCVPKLTYGQSHHPNIVNIWFRRTQPQYNAGRH